MSAGTLEAGEYDLQVAKIVSSTGKEIPIDLAILSITIFEDIDEFSLIGELVIQDSMNLASYAPIIGQEYLKLKIATPTINEPEYIIDFTENPFMITTIDKRKEEGHNTQQTVMTFVSRELLVNQRKKVTRTLTGSYDKIVKDLLRGDLECKKRIYWETSAENKKFVAPNQSPMAIIDKAMKHAVSKKYQDPTFKFFESLRGYNFRTLGNLYDQEPLMTYETFVEGTKTKGGASAIDTDLRSILNYVITGTPDIVYNYKEGMYASELVVHNIITKNYTKHDYNYINEFGSERHLDKAPLVNTLKITEDKKNVSSFPAKTFLAPVSCLGEGNPYDGSFEDSSNYFSYTSNTPERHILQRNSNLGMLETGLSVNIKVHGNTAICCGDTVNCHIPYVAATKTEDNEKYDNLYQGKFLVTKVRHDFKRDTKKYEMSLILKKDSLPTPLVAPGDNPEPISEKDVEEYSDIWIDTWESSEYV